MVAIVRTKADNAAFIKLVSYLDADLAERDGEEHNYYHTFNKIDKIQYAVVAYENEIAVGCGAIKAFESTAMEVKRMYTIAESRGKGIATKILCELEKWAAEMGYEKCVLETGRRQPEAIQLYQRNGYVIIPNYGQYKGIANSVCFEKWIKK